MSVYSRAVRLGGAVTAAGAVAAALYVPDVRFHVASVAGGALQYLDPETAHSCGIAMAKWGFFPRDGRVDDPRLRVRAIGRTFSNPIGVAAGFDKDGEAIEGILGLGVGFMEVGSITPEPQPGNPMPRCFRLPEHRAIVNRMGFNSGGGDAAERRLEAYAKRRNSGAADTSKVLAVNLGKNRTTADAALDYCAGVQQLAPHADVLVINVSSPNTPGLRALQGRSQLLELVTRVQAALDTTQCPQGRPPLLVKIAPDLSEADKADIAAVALRCRLDGLVIGNTTVSRPQAVAAHPASAETGGLSGQPLFDLSTEVLRDMYSRTNGAIPLVACGGVSSGAQAYAKFRAGACLVEMYSGLAYEGPALIPRMKRELLHCLEADGLPSVEAAIAADHRPGHGAVTRAGTRWRRAAWPATPKPPEASVAV